MKTTCYYARLMPGQSGYKEVECSLEVRVDRQRPEIAIGPRAQMIDGWKAVFHEWQDFVDFRDVVEAVYNHLRQEHE